MFHCLFLHQSNGLQSQIFPQITRDTFICCLSLQRHNPYTRSNCPWNFKSVNTFRSGSRITRFRAFSLACGMLKLLLAPPLCDPCPLCHRIRRAVNGHVDKIGQVLHPIPQIPLFSRFFRGILVLDISQFKNLLIPIWQLIKN